MKRALKGFAGTTLVAALAYLFFWPVPVDPVGWDAPPDPGYTGPFAENHRLAVQRLALKGRGGPECAVAGPAGELYVSSESGEVLLVSSAGVQPYAKTGGRPLGLALDDELNLYIADAYKGLLKVDRRDRILTEVVTAVDGERLGYVDDVAVSPDGAVWFSDASRKFGAQAWGGTYPASLLDLMEHGGHGRLLRYDPFNGKTSVILDGLQFANGVAADPQGDFVLVAETGAYRVQKYHLKGPKAGQAEPLLGPLPCFPDNLAAGADGRFWVGCISPRSKALDALAGWPLLRKLVQRLPEAVRPKAQRRGHVIAFDREGRILHDLQDPSGRYAFATGAVEADGWLYVTSLKMPTLGRMPLAEALKERL